MKFALQLYTVRDLTTTVEGFREVLRKTKDIGYEGVQISAVGCMNGEPPLVTAREARQMIDGFGLECGATHRPWERFRNNLEEEIQFHHDLGCKHAAIGMPPKAVQEGGQDDWKQFADELSEVALKLKPAGIKFGYHDHAFEFERLAPDGKRPFDILMERCDPAVFFLLDTYWVAHAGVEVPGLVARLKGRLPVIHLKDKGVFGWETDFAPVGEGNLDWARILPVFEEAGTEWAAVEQDTCRRDVWDCVTSSLKFLKRQDR